MLGHIKGTYGFVDDKGQIKRVSYTTSNSTEVVTTQESPTVVQRIPSRNRTTTKRPNYLSSSYSSTQVSPTTTANSVVQSIARRRPPSSLTTLKPNQSTNKYDKTVSNQPNHPTYTSAPPRVLLQGRPSLSSNTGQIIKSEGQLIRPEVVTIKPTESLFTNGLNSKRLEVDKPVHEEYEPEERSNILRRQLSPQNNNQNYAVRDQLQQSLGHDSSDIYTNSMSTVHPKPPLFTTTSRPGPVSISTTPFPLSVARPLVPYPENYQSRAPQDFDQQQRFYSQEITTSRPLQHHSTPIPIPIVQIPANKLEETGPFVAFRHPSQREAILVPLSQVQGKLIPIDQINAPNDDQRQYIYQEPTQNTRVIEIEQQKAVVRRLPPPSLRPIPVKVDGNGYIRELSHQVPAPSPYPVPLNSAAAPESVNAFALEPISKYVETDIDNDIDSIQPPVSTRDFQKLLQQLILRQSRLEKVSMLTRQPEVFAPPVRPSPLHHQQVPFLSHQDPNSPFAFVQQEARVQAQRNLQRNVDQGIHHKPRGRFQPQDFYIDQYDSQAYIPNRRVARLQPSSRTQQQLLGEEDKNEYLPPDVREMLLLRMLQLAINPTLPIDENDIEIVSAPVKKKPVRNVEILGEEVESTRKSSERMKRFISF